MALRATFVTGALLGAGIAVAEEARPSDPATLLFETQQWALAPPGATLAYRYVRKSASEAVFGPSFEDTVRVHVDKGASDATRTARVELFTGEHRRPSGAFEDVGFNPVLMLFLEHHVEQLSRSLHGNPRYFKNAIRAALRDKFKMESAETSVDGRSVNTWRVVIAPFLDDPNKARMNGLEGLVYDLSTSEQVPGEITELTATATGPDGLPVLEEKLVYDPKGD